MPSYTGKHRIAGTMIAISKIHANKEHKRATGVCPRCSYLYHDIEKFTFICMKTKAAINTAHKNKSAFMIFLYRIRKTSRSISLYTYTGPHRYIVVMPIPRITTGSVRGNAQTTTYPHGTVHGYDSPIHPHAQPPNRVSGCPCMDGLWMTIKP